MPFEKQGVNVSSWQGNIAWDRTKAHGVQFAMIRAEFSRQTDKKFASNLEGALSAGLPCGSLSL